MLGSGGGGGGGYTAGCEAGQGDGGGTCTCEGGGRGHETRRAAELGGKMPLAVDQRIERQNSAADKLAVEMTHAVKEGTGYVAYVKIVWGDLDNVIKGTGSQYYANWDGNLKLTGGATGKIDEKIQFDDGGPKAGDKPEGSGSAEARADRGDQAGGGSQEAAGKHWEEWHRPGGGAARGVGTG